MGIIGCGAVGTKRADALGHDTLVGCFDVDPRASSALSRRFGGRACASVDDLLAMEPDVVVVAVTHDALADNACHALRSGAHVLVEKPAGIGVADVDRIAETAEAVGRRVKVGFNHRFHPAISHAVSEASSGRFGPITHVRGRYGHGGRVGYEHEWRADRARSGGGELVDQGMHLLDLSYALLGPLPLHSALLRTAFWPMDVEDNAVVILGERESGPWAMFHTSWTEWKNLFSLEVFCATGKLQVDGLAGSYGEQRLVIFAMRPEMGVAGRRGAELPVGRRVVGARMGGVHSGRLGRGRPTVGGRPPVGPIRLELHRGRLRPRRAARSPCLSGRCSRS